MDMFRLQVDVEETTLRRRASDRRGWLMADMPQDRRAVALHHPPCTGFNHNWLVTDFHPLRSLACANLALAAMRLKHQSLIVNYRPVEMKPIAAVLVL